MPKSTESPLFHRRLPQYLRILRRFLEQGIYRCSSADIAQHTTYSAVAVRRDLLPFSACAKQGYGYRVAPLYTMLSDHLGLRDSFRAVAVGDPTVTEALARHPLFSVHGIRLLASFAPKDCAQLPAYCTQSHISILLLTTPLPIESYPLLKEAGVLGVYALYDLSPAEITALQAVDLCYQCLSPFDDLIALCCTLKQTQKKEDSVP